MSEVVAEKVRYVNQMKVTTSEGGKEHTVGDFEDCCHGHKDLATAMECGRRQAAVSEIGAEIIAAKMLLDVTLKPTFRIVRRISTDVVISVPAERT